ncbi:isocitrate dehydrogenase (NAD+) [Galdieria sulphuraria]|uniref:Isocitrate dehydrogenase (NAD+) n=1 Tax=Galdieria sulphuraria TaxID=130081 RepID=M2VWG3_GALSU|nr:isocitrate dehydrogenase (NAD+) [Galdieria sulphuraria]EME27586.1 isocitrate dehydrogenase (NAD+) [Galdieria sulphuraria]|eukprot:XP_005704106.1 isocitrate dehydrogenase (NAD+) [Galdieria sulphuraria]
MSVATVSKFSKSLWNASRYLFTFSGHNSRNWSLANQKGFYSTEREPMVSTSLKYSSFLEADHIGTDPFPLGGQVTSLHTVTVLPGTTIGKETSSSLMNIFHAAGVPVKFEVLEVTNPEEGVPEDVQFSLRKNRVAIKGPFPTNPLSTKDSFNISVRRGNDLFANVVHCFNIPGVKSRYNDVDIVLIRENTEGEYSGLEHETIPGVVENLKVISERASMRIAEYAFQYATKNGRKKVTCVHKANIMKMADGLFLECCRRVASKYPFIQFDSMIVDNTCMQLVSRPEQFDVMVLPNLYGNIVGNIVAGILGGPGLFPGANIGEHMAVFEQGARHSGRNIGGQNIANPTGVILSGVMMLRYLQLSSYANRIEFAVLEALKNSKNHTADIGGNASTTDFTQAVIDNLN